METKMIIPGVYSAELVVPAMWEALGLGISLLAEKCLLCLVLEAGSLPVHVFQGCPVDESLPFSLCKKQERNVQDADDYDGVPKDDNVTPKDDDIHKKGDDDGLEDHNMAGGEGSSEGDQEFDDNSGSYSDGGSDEDDNDDTDMEDYSDDEEETDEEDEDDREDEKSDSEDSTDDNKQYPRLKNARDVYTSEDTFRLFEHERRKTRTLEIDVKSDMDLRDRGLEITYEVRKSWQFEGRYTVTVLPLDGIVECSCKFFESSGVLCSHSQVALKCLRIDKIPDRYILQKDKNLAPGPAEGSLIKNQEECRQSSPHHTDFKRYAGPGCEIISGFQADEEIRTDYIDPPLLRHASEIFSLNIFSMFQKEYKKSEYLIAREDDTIIIDGGLVVLYIVEKTGNYSYFSVPRHAVLTVPSDGTVSCSCGKFEKTGLLCCHAIVVLDYLCIVKIPGRYILDQFKKDETVSAVQQIHGPESEESVRLLESRLDKVEDVLKCIQINQEYKSAHESRINELKDVLKGIKNNLDPEKVDGDIQLARGKSTSAAKEPTVKESTDSHNDSTSQVFGKVKQSTNITGASSCSSPPTNFGTQSDAADK